MRSANEEIPAGRKEEEEEKKRNCAIALDIMDNFSQMCTKQQLKKKR